MPGYANPYYPYQQSYQPPALSPMPDQLAQYRQQYQQPMPMQTPAPQMQAQPQQPAGSILWVRSEQEARDFLVAPNNAVVLWDSNSPVIYLKQADASGKPSMKIYDLVERTAMPSAPAGTAAADYVTRKEFDELSALVNRLTMPKQPAHIEPTKEAEPNA